MAVIPLGERPPRNEPQHGIVPFALGFRPFFLMAALAAITLLPLWLATWLGTLPPSAYYGPITWHSHEMLFGYSGAVIAGFLLTAVRNWTGIDTLTGRPLAALTLVWLAARIAPFIPGLPGAVIAGLDLLFLPLFMWALYQPLMRAQNRRNRLFLPLLGLMLLADLLIHMELLGLPGSITRGTDLMLNSVLLLLIWVSGRVLPFFTEKAVAEARPRDNQRREQFVFASAGLWILLNLLWPQPLLLAASALLVAGTQAWRWRDWHHLQVWRIPILAVLFSGLGWIILGFLLETFAALGLFPGNLARHALTVGGVGVLTLGMMARVSLGHTGRELLAPSTAIWAFALLNLGAIIRVFMPAIVPSSYTLWITLSGTLWTTSFLLFAITYLPILLRPRVDGRPG
ncbi:NnrS family protein [Candidatus Endoriftia persephone]|jgi:uncharacterized protein involved in response to NO|uniref:NnrS protein involved in response to NO n=3 Tax=Gammaproteobacteria TaxID=1236 RepID=G2FAV5_9GAMM|nr:NnrS family protein [Candidatus Endoriftia persephone]EGV51607.1 NnrS family protein [endosymbiont of Riftia pachyptila (vent Ph05)]EGW55893.1 NnrS protein involved in response to NO [endosymbiont of Tevnia jerichonana (vent Tica)]USF88028.1 NnrS family protein [Candidatus Endoriftia persephone]